MPPSCNTNYNGEDVAYSEPQRCWLRSLTSVTYLCMLLRINSTCRLAATRIITGRMSHTPSRSVVGYAR
ncbi:hypothetical protein C9446_03075 [Providencia heimbachae]|nr:hypothetical protein C9446_03075 [Providencia heimbachae]